MGLKGKIFKFLSDILKDGCYYKLYTQVKSTSACGLPKGFFIIKVWLCGSEPITIRRSALILASNQPITILLTLKCSRTSSKVAHITSPRPSLRQVAAPPSPQYLSCVEHWLGWSQAAHKLLYVFFNIRSSYLSGDQIPGLQEGPKCLADVFNLSSNRLRLWLQACGATRSSRY